MWVNSYLILVLEQVMEKGSSLFYLPLIPRERYSSREMQILARERWQFSMMVWY
jgi:hypothetical protein